VCRVAKRFSIQAGGVDLRTLKITSENLEQVLNDLIAGIEDLEAAEEKLGLSLRNMTQLMKESVHNDDIYHNGEDVLTHIGWVMDDVHTLSEHMTADKKALLKLTALCHDLGKAYTYRYDPVKKKHTFHGHAEKSVEIAKVFLARHKEALGELYQDVLDFTRLHDVFYALAYERTQVKGTKYVRRLMNEAIYQKGLLRDLFEFARADSYRAKAHAQKLKETEALFEDLAAEEQSAKEAELLEVQRKAFIKSKLPEVQAYLEQVAPDAATLLPNMVEVNQLLGRTRRFDVLKKIRSMLTFQDERFKLASAAHARSVALMKFLSRATQALGIAKHVYVVGGAVRNWMLNQPIKDIDVVIDSIGAKKDSEWLAKRLREAIPAGTNLTTNQYGVAILTVKDSWVLDGHDMQGEVIEIANARKESYGGEEGKGYKPHLVEPATIEEDLSRREFTFNTLLWRLLDLEHGPDRAEVLDLLGVGRQHLEQKELRTPVDPDKTFSDDPTRMLRAIKFTAKYNFKIPPDVVGSIRRNAPKLKQMPWDAVRKILVEDILEGPAPRESVKLLKHLGLSDTIGEMLHETQGFAAALARSLSEKETHLVLDLLDLGWTMKTPVSFLGSTGLVRLREILLSSAEDPGFAAAFVQALTKPPLDQPKLFVELNIPLKERGSLVQTARKLLLSDPQLALRGLEEAVRRELS